uniref:Transmembrane protein 132E n=1 Tax=Timema shepardi TaxID=629360 RepID=A0A7R9FZM2_TIMSH|nr:unnamed protein product [Timema shepardi]
MLANTTPTSCVTNKCTPNLLGMLANMLVLGEPVSSSCSSVYVDGSEIRGSSNASVLVKYGTYTGLAKFTVWMPEFPLEVNVADFRLSQVKGWKVPGDHTGSVKMKRSLDDLHGNRGGTYRGWGDSGAVSPDDLNGVDPDRHLSCRIRFQQSPVEWEIQVLQPVEEVLRLDLLVGLLLVVVLGQSYLIFPLVQESILIRVYGLQQFLEHCQGLLRVFAGHCYLVFFVASELDDFVFARFLAKDHDSGSERYFVSRRTSLRVTDLVLSLLRVSDPRIASLHGRILQGRGMGRTEVQVLSPITGRVIGAKEVRVGNDKVSISRLQVRVVSGLQLAITPDSAVENGYIAETSVTRRLTAQYQEGLLDIDLEFSDGSRTPLREVAVSDYHLLVESLDPEVVAFAPMVASHHPRVIAVGEGRSDLLHVALLLAEECRAVPRRTVSGKLPGSGKPNSNAPLAAASAYVEVDFSASDIPQRPEFVQNDGGGVVGGNHGSRDRKNNRDMPADMHDIHIGIPIKDENNHEPTVQARQHHSAAKGLAPAGLGHHHHNNMHMTPLEIGMYVLLAAFCFAIVVFVVSCVVYASKFKPQTMECPSHSAIAGGSTGLEPLGASVGKSAGNEGMGIGGASGVNNALGGKKQPRESTTNAHDWVWLGRATLERASGHVIVGASLSGRSPPIFNNNNNVAVGGKDDQQICITTNPMNYTVETLDEGQNLGTCFDNPNHIDLPSRAPAIDSSTYCKKEKVPGRHQFVAHNSPSRSTHHKPQHKESAADKLWQIPPPPPLPPHGMSLGVKPVGGVTVVDGVEYKPPVPPHRNIGVSARIGPSRQQPGPLPGFLPQQDGATARGAVPQTPAPSRRHHHHHHHHRNSGSNHHRAGKSSTTSHQQDQDCKMEDNGVPHQKPSAANLCAELQQHQMRHQGKEDPLAPKNHLKRQSKEDRYYTAMREDEDEDECHQETAFVEFPSASGGTTSAQRKGNSPEVKRATIVGNPMFSAADDVDEDFRLREELLGLEDLNLGMDYEQIMEYFDNLKESNA